MNARPSSLERRRTAADKHRPQNIRLLLVAEAPPSAEDRYFYFEDVTEQDSLFRYVCKGLFGTTPDRSGKTSWLARLQRKGVFLIDLIEHPIGASKHSDHVPDLIDRCRSLKPDRIILIKAPVFDAAFVALRDAGLPVSSVRIPFPGSGQQKKFEETFAKAIQNLPPKDEPPTDPGNQNVEKGSVAAINHYLQAKVRDGSELSAVEAARLLDLARLLKDSESRPGKPIRDLLRAGKILGAHQEPNRRWFIRRS